MKNISKYLIPLLGIIFLLEIFTAHYYALQAKTILKERENKETEVGARFEKQGHFLHPNPTTIFTKNRKLIPHEYNHNPVRPWSYGIPWKTEIALLPQLAFSMNRGSLEYEYFSDNRYRSDIKKMKPVLNLQVIFGFEFLKRCVVESGFIFQQKGSFYKGEFLNGEGIKYNGSVRRNLTYFSVPLWLRFQTLLKDFRVYGRGGITAGYRISAKEITTNNTLNYETDIKDKTDFIEASSLFACGVELNSNLRMSYFAEFNFSYGLMPFLLSSPANFALRNTLIGVGFGVRFHSDR